MNSYGLQKRDIAVIILLSVPYVLLRVMIIGEMNAYLDYDEGTYLMFARFIQEGFLPYKDIFAVHPPLYYYALAGWMWAFGDSYIIGRMFSMFLGLLSIAVAYYTGKELKDWRLGMAFAFLLAIDPMAIKLNTLVIHGSMIEFFTLLSLWALIKYTKTGRLKFAYYSLIAASIGSTAKFTIIPFLVALYVLVLFSTSTELKQYLFRITNRIFTFEQGRVIAITYLLWSAIVVTIGVLVPVSIVRIIAIIPGVHGITKLGHIYSSVMFLFFWLGLTVYLLKIRYVSDILPFLRTLLKTTKTALALASLVIVSKALVELPLGLFVSPDYISQTYLEQSSRGFPFVGIFWFINNILTTLQSDKLDSAVYILPALLLTVAFLIARYFDNSATSSQSLKSFLFLNTLFYLVAIPIIPNIRMVYSFVLVFYLTVLYSLFSGITDKKRLATIVFVFSLLFIADIGVAINYPRGKLAIPATPNIKEVRDDLGEYITSKKLTGTYLSINPIDAYYLNLTTIPYMVDTFGLGYLRGENLTELIRNSSPKYIIFDTWMFEITRKSNVLFEVYQPVLMYTIANGTLLFAESTPNGECVELFKISQKTVPWAVMSSNGTLEIYYNSTRALTLVPNISKQYFLEITNIEEGVYSIFIKNDTNVVGGTLLLNQTSVVLNSPNVTWKLSFSGIPLKDNEPLYWTNESRALLCTPKKCFYAVGTLEIRNGTVWIQNRVEIYD